jgi:membrane-anchored protein YejM (alkaline phosphatase superfamily)
VACVAWAVLHPHESGTTIAWQSFLVAIAVIVVAEWLQSAYRREQDRIRRRRL